MSSNTSDKIQNTFSNSYSDPKNNNQYSLSEKLKSLFMTIIEKEHQNNNMKLCLFNSQDFNPNTVFSSIDTQKKNFIDLNDFKEFLQKKSINFNELTLRKFIHLYNKHKNFQLIYDDFYLMLKPIDVNTELRGGGTVDELLKSIFEGSFEVIENINEMIIDIRKTDYFTSFEAFLGITKGSKYINEEFLTNFLPNDYNKNEIKHLLYLMDLNNDGLVSYEEFIDFLTPLGKYSKYTEGSSNNNLRNYEFSSSINSIENDYTTRNYSPRYSRGSYYNEINSLSGRNNYINNLGSNYYTTTNRNYNFYNNNTYQQNRASYRKYIEEVSQKYNNYKFEKNDNSYNYLKSDYNKLSSPYKHQNFNSFNNEETRNEIRSTNNYYNTNYSPLNKKYDNQYTIPSPKSITNSFNNPNYSNINTNYNNFIYKSVSPSQKENEKKYEKSNGVKFEIKGKEKTLSNKKTIEFQKEHNNIELICNKKKQFDGNFKIEENVNINILNDTPRNLNNNIISNNDNIKNNTNKNINNNSNKKTSCNNIINNNDSIDNINNKSNKNINDNINNKIKDDVNDNINVTNKKKINNSKDDVYNTGSNTKNKQKINNIKQTVDYEEYINDFTCGNNNTNSVNTNSNKKIFTTIKNTNNDSSLSTDRNKQNNYTKNHIKFYVNTEENSKTNYNDEVDNEHINKLSEKIFNNDSIQCFLKYIQEVIELEKKTLDMKEKLCLRDDITLKDLFCVFDFQQKNHILARDFKSVCKSNLKLYPTTDQVNLVFNRYDRNKDGNLNTKEFFYMIRPIKNEYASILLDKKKNGNKNLSYKQLSEKSQKLIINVIRTIIEDEGKYYKFKYNELSDKLFDVKELWEAMGKYVEVSKENGGVNKEGLNKFLMDCGLCLSSYDLDIIINKIDFDGDKTINYDDLEHEFINYF